MRADNDHELGNSVQRCGDESKSHQFSEEDWEDGTNDNSACELLFYDTRSGDECDKGNALECHSCETGKKIRDTAKGDSPEKVDPVYYTDKNVTASDLPEIMVCYKENTYPVVKDICVDEGVAVNEDSMKAEKVILNPLETKYSEDGNSKDLKKHRDREETSGKDFTDAGGSSNCNQEDLIVTEEEVEESPTYVLRPSSRENSKNEVAMSSENVIEKPLTLGDIISREDKRKLLNNGPEEQSPFQLQEEEKKRFETKALETELKETEQNRSSVSTTISQEQNKTCNDPEEPGAENRQQNYVDVEKRRFETELKETEEQEQNRSFVSTTISYETEKRLASSFGETSFSAAEAVSGHITYSGPIAFSGSLSVRSDASSTTSGRSFAFPILQSEWNSSPVRMAKADKRRQKGWRHILVCCRFS